MTIEEARRIVESKDATDPKLALEAVAMVLRFNGVADKRLLSIAAKIEKSAEEIKMKPNASLTRGEAVALKR